MIINALMVGLALAIAKFFQWWGTLGTERPLICVPIVGLLLGHPIEGIMMGAALELVFLGSIQMGGTVPQEYTVGGVFGAAFAIILDKPTAVAITLAIPLSMLGVFLYNLMKVYFTALVERFDRYLEEKDDKSFLRLWKVPGIVYVLYYFLMGFVGILAGTATIEKVVDVIPDSIMSSLNVAAGMLPALGFAMLLKALWKKKLALFFFAGFGLAVFFKLTLIGVAFFSICLAVYICITEISNKTPMAIAGNHMNNRDTEEDFFDE
ncbi:PTS mannose/fructose/sorbose/N-acetylgalactosamine transporter subunit IIC [Rossellomorea marisflavi]|uniref:PTS mannose/fructose/sorbose/N-acetylgalactosamine transporter subunit IIC n=1 Tax=Rossellomorea marisflavi TaxID=189381 RepID=UPI0035120DA8